MTHQYHRNGIRQLKTQVPHPRLTGMSTTNTVLVDEAKTTAWLSRWEREYRGEWVEFRGMFYPRDSVPEGSR